MLVLGMPLADVAARDYSPVWIINPERFAAIAYSPSTGKYGYSYNYRSRSAAERMALEHLPQPDARIVCWVQAGFCALALGDDKSEWGVGYSYGRGARTEDARAAAVEECGKRTTHPHLAVLVLSDGQVVWDTAPDAAASPGNREPGDKAKTEADRTSQFPAAFPTAAIGQANITPAPKPLVQMSPSPTEKKRSLDEIFKYGKTESSTTPAQGIAQASSWQISWDAFLTVVEQELNRLPANAVGPWDGKEVTWEGTVQDMEVMTAKNVVRLVVGMQERTLSIKGRPVTANRVMIFVPMTYENMGPAQIGAKVRFKTIIAPIDAAHPAVFADAGKDGGKGFLVIFTRGGTLLKQVGADEKEKVGSRK